METGSARAAQQQGIIGVTFTYKPAGQCAAVAGATHRAVYVGNDRDHIFKLFRTHQDFTIIVGKGDYDAAAARITEILKPWACKLQDRQGDRREGESAANRSGEDMVGTGL